MPYLITIFGLLHNVASSVRGVSHARNIPNGKGMYGILPELQVTMVPMSISLLFDKVLHPTEYYEDHALLYQKQEF